MRRQITTIFLAACLALNLAGCTMFKFAQPKAAPSSAAAALIAKMPAASSAEGDKLYAELIKLGPAQIEALCGTLAPWSGNDEKVEYALSGVATYAARPGAEAERKMVSEALLKALKETSDKEVQAFIIRLLERVGKDEAVAPLSRLLKDEKLCAPAVKVLLTIKTPQATEALVRALPTAKNSSQRVTIIQALGTLRATEAARSIMKFTASEEPAVRLEAWYALANLGEPKAEPVLAAAAREAAPQERAKAASYYLLFARRQAEAGQPKACARICRALMQESSALGIGQIQCAALTTLADAWAWGPQANAELIKVMDQNDPALRATALRLAERMSGLASDSSWTNKPWVAKLNQVQSPVVRAEIVRMLGNRAASVQHQWNISSDSGYRPEILQAIHERLQDPDGGVRQAAIEVAGKLNLESGLMMVLSVSTDAADLDAAKAALLRQPAVFARRIVTQAYPLATPEGRIRMLEVMGARRMTDQKTLCFAAAGDADAKIRLAALKAVRDVAGEQDLGVGLNMLGVLGARRMTNQRGLCFTAAGDADAKVRLAALKAIREVATEEDLEVTLDLLLAAKGSAEQTAARNAVAGILERCQDRAAATALVQGAYARVPSAQKAVLLEVMPRLNSAGALQTVRKEARSANAATREAAIRALADWSDAAPMDDLLSLSKTSTNTKIRILAYRGYVRMIGARQGVGDTEKVELCRKAMAAAPSREEARPVLTVLGSIASPEAFRIAAASLDDSALREEAALAAIAIAGKIGRQIPNEVKPAMQKVVKVVSNQATRNKAQGVLNSLDGKTPTARPRRNSRAAAK